MCTGTVTLKLYKILHLLFIIGNLITFTAALLVILDPESSNGSKVGLILTYAMTVTQVLNHLVKCQADLETNIVAVERIKEYTEMQNEADWSSQNPPSNHWPDFGEMEFKNYAMRYREGLDLVLKSIGVNIKGGEKVGIVGRTGAGKSSFTIALFRLVEPAHGSIMIDNLDVTKMGLHELRTKLTIIPQGNFCEELGEACPVFGSYTK